MSDVQSTDAIQQDDQAAQVAIQIVYSYSPDDNRYLENTIAFESPLEPGIFLIPANTTVVHPGDPQDRKYPVWNSANNQWDMVDNYTEVTLYSTETGDLVVIDKLGVAPDDTMTELKKPDDTYSWDAASKAWVVDPAKVAAAQQQQTQDQVTQDQIAKASALSIASSVIAPLQYATDLGIATSAETTKMTAWKTYAVLVNRIDPTIQPVTWPTVPAQ